MLGELRVTPVDSGEAFARVVADVARIVSESDLEYQLHGMGTTVEGELDDILDVVRRSHAAVREHSDRVLIEVSIDDRGTSGGELLRGVERVRALVDETPTERIGRA